MKIELISVTPALAREWLKKNTKNRAIRPAHVETLRQSFERGEQVTTHQGIAFDTDGILIDGQHRLNAIALMHEGFSFLMMVTWGLDRDKVFPVVDATQAKRSTADVLLVDRNVGEAANFLARLYKGSPAGITPTYVAPFVEFVQPQINELVSFCSKTARTWSSAPVRGAAVISMKHGDPDYTKDVYRTLVTQDFENMPRIAQSLFRAQTAGSVRASAANDIFARCLKVFDPFNAKLSKVQINDVSDVVNQTREMLNYAFLMQAKKKEDVERGVKKVAVARHLSNRNHTGSSAH